MIRFKSFLFVCIVLALSACSDDGASPQCEANEQERCFCSDGAEGLRTCAEDGKSWGMCYCEDKDTGAKPGTDTGTQPVEDTGTGVEELPTDTEEPQDSDTGTGSAPATDTGTSDAADSESDLATDTPTETDTGTGSIMEPDAGEALDGGRDTGTEGPDPCAECTDLDGVDLLVVIDNSNSMIEEQQILATGFYTLINALVNPTEDWSYPPAKDVRVGVVSTDMGLQWGEDGELTESKTGCEGSGDDGAFMTTMPESIDVESLKIKCDLDDDQCPTSDWVCPAGTCVAPGGSVFGTVPCPALEGEQWTETARFETNLNLVTQVSCLAQLGNEGCGIEQQLKAPIRALERDDQAAFVRDDYLLAVIVVSDEEDCSISDDGLFETEEWRDPTRIGSINTACNYPEENEESFLFPVRHFYDKLVGVKGGNAASVVFAAIVGVPNGAGSPCEGAGDEISGCLDDPRMQLEIGEYQVGDATITHFVPACERQSGNTVVTSARPGRRFVALAEEFGCAGYVYSICNEDWSQAMTEIARMIVKCIDVT